MMPVTQAGTCKRRITRICICSRKSANRRRVPHASDSRTAESEQPGTTHAHQDAHARAHDKSQYPCPHSHLARALTDAAHTRQLPPPHQHLLENTHLQKSHTAGDTERRDCPSTVTSTGTRHVMSNFQQHTHTHTHSDTQKCTHIYWGNTHKLTASTGARMSARAAERTRRARERARTAHGALAAHSLVPASPSLTVVREHTHSTNTHSRQSLGAKQAAARAQRAAQAGGTVGQGPMDPGLMRALGQHRARKDAFAGYQSTFCMYQHVV